MPFDKLFYDLQTFSKYTSTDVKYHLKYYVEYNFYDKNCVEFTFETRVASLLFSSLYYEMHHKYIYI